MRQIPTIILIISIIFSSQLCESASSISSSSSSSDDDGQTSIILEAMPIMPGSSLSSSDEMVQVESAPSPVITSADETEVEPDAKSKTDGVESGRQMMHHHQMMHIQQPVAEAPSIITSPEKPKLNVIEVLKGMGSAIQLLISQHKHQANEGDSRADLPIGSSSSSSEDKQKYREQAENLRSEINRRSGQLQKVVGAAIEALKDRGDVVVRRILENLQNRLNQAKQRADKILGEPESSELAVRTLNSINQGMNNLSSLVQHVLSRVNISINVDLKDNPLAAAGAKSVGSSLSSVPAPPPVNPAVSQE